MARAKVLPAAIFLPDRGIDKTEIDSVAAAGSLFSLTPEHRCAIGQAMIEYNENLAIWGAAATPKDVTKNLAVIGKLASNLLNALARLARGSVASEAIAWNRLGDNLSDRTMREEAITSVAFLTAAAQRATVGLVAKEGRKGNPYRPIFIRELHAIFLSAGGQGKISKRSRSPGEYTGRFVDMTAVALAAIEGAPLTNSALGRAIENALSPELSEK